MERALYILFPIAGIVFALGIVFMQTPTRFAHAEQILPQTFVSTTITGEFNQTGTLAFYPNNNGPVPYLFYRDAKGAVVAKALIFSHTKTDDLAEWSGARIQVTGTIDDEHVAVTSATYVDGP